MNIIGFLFSFSTPVFSSFRYPFIPKAIFIQLNINFIRWLNFFCSFPQFKVLASCIFLCIQRNSWWVYASSKAIFDRFRFDFHWKTHFIHDDAISQESYWCVDRFQIPTWPVSSPAIVSSVLFSFSLCSDIKLPCIIG
jgi:hypothetical protein